MKLVCYRYCDSILNGSDSVEHHMHTVLSLLLEIQDTIELKQNRAQSMLILDNLAQECVWMD